MTDLSEYTGQLIGGPDDGNPVTASTKEIPAVSTTELWLDGKEEGKTPVLILWKGVYLWNEAGYFTWKTESNELVRKSPELV